MSAVAGYRRRVGTRAVSVANIARRALPPAALATVTLAAPFGAHAQEWPPSVPDERPAPSGSVKLDAVAQHGLTEKWAWRKRLAEKGVVLAAHLYSQVSVNARGYRGSGVAYAQQADFKATLDLAKLGVTEGTLRVMFSDRVGHTIQDRTGAYIEDQNFYGQGQNFRFDELSYERSFAGGDVRVKGGFYAMGNDFGTLPYTCNFNNNGHCSHPLSLPTNSGWQDPPTGAWGARVKVQATDKLYVEAGAFDVTPDRKLPGDGFNLGFPHTTGVIIPVELGYVSGESARDYPATIKIGAYYDSSRVADIAVPTRTRGGRGGVYLEAAKQVWKARPGSVQGLALFGIVTRSDAATALFQTYYEAGLSFRGPLGSRGDDVLSVGWVLGQINGRLSRAGRDAGQPPKSSEQLVELNYAAQATRWLLVRPAVQYAIRPGALATRPNTVLFTLHVQATL